MKALRTLIGFAALTVTAGAGVVSVRGLEEHRAVMDLCTQVEAGFYERALSNSEALVGPSEAGRIAAECRCDAQLATGAAAACEASLSDLAFAPELRDEGWVPRRDLSVHLVQTLRSAGQAERAADLATRAARLYPDDPELFYLEMATRVSVEDEGTVLDELEARLDEAVPAAARMRVSLANRHLLRGDPRRAIAVLGEAPRSDDAAHTRWYETVGLALASGRDLGALRQHFSAWRATGTLPEAELAARYAITLSITGLVDPERSHLSLLDQALLRADEIVDPEIQETLVIRSILTLSVAGETDRALALFDTWRPRFELAGLERSELERSAAQQLRFSEGTPAAEGKLVFAVPDGSSEATLFVSPAPDTPLDTEFERHEIRGGHPVEVRRFPDLAPVRWVLRSAADVVLASGSTNPRPGAQYRVNIEPSQPARNSVGRERRLSRLPADGRTRIALLLLDCADWRLVQYLRARNELPTIDLLLRSGLRAVLDSDPPLTAAALESIVRPGSPLAPSFVGVLHQMGTELAALASVGSNPLAGLSWLLPERPDLFGVIGSGDLSAVNLLFAHGGIQAGRHGVVTGPNGATQQLATSASARDLHADERSRWPALAAITRERDAVHLRTIAAEFDTAAAIVGAKRVDLLALRIEPLDILTHAHFARTVREGQDDGALLLYEVYRYIDARVAEVSASLDDDDVLSVMSDHGIRTAMEHDRPAFFVAHGGGIPAGRVDGTPRLRGVPRAIADLLGVETDWPDEGISASAGKRVASREASARAAQ